MRLILENLILSIKINNSTKSIRCSVAERLSIISFKLQKSYFFIIICGLTSVYIVNL